MEAVLRPLTDLGDAFDHGLNLGELSVGWKMLTEPLPVQRNMVLNQATVNALNVKGENGLLNRLRDELTSIADTKIKNAGVSVATTSYVITSTLGTCVGTPVLFDKLGFSFWENLATSSLVALTCISPTISGLFGMTLYPWVRKVSGEFAKPFILNKIRNDADAFLKSEGLLK